MDKPSPNPADEAASPDSANTIDRASTGTRRRRSTVPSAVPVMDIPATRLEASSERDGAAREPLAVTMPGGAMDLGTVAIGRLDARDVAVSKGAVGGVRADRVSVEMGVLGGALAGEANVSQALVGTVIGREVRVEQSIVRTLIAGEVRVDRPTGVIVMIAGRVAGDVRTLLDWRAALAFGAAFGVVVALAGRRRRPSS